MIENRVDHDLVVLDHVEDARGQACLKCEFGEPDGNRRSALRWFEDEGVAARDRRGRHPQRNHRWEVERRYTRGNAERLAHGIDIDARSGALGILALQQMRDAARKLDHVETALDVAL